MRQRDIDGFERQWARRYRNRFKKFMDTIIKKSDGAPLLFGHKNCQKAVVVEDSQARLSVELYEIGAGRDARWLDGHSTYLVVLDLWRLYSHGGLKPAFLGWHPQLQVVHYSGAIGPTISPWNRTNQCYTSDKKLVFTRTDSCLEDPPSFLKRLVAFHNRTTPRLVLE